MSKKIIIGNWKMKLNIKNSLALGKKIKQLLKKKKF
jgi:triosephosphate isomerase